MTHKNKIFGIIVLVILASLGYYYFFNRASQKVTLDSTPQKVTLSGTYLCLPHLDTSGPQTEECAFGLQTDEKVYYAVDFGQSTNAMEVFQSGSQIKAEGLIVTKEALNTNQWAKYNMKGIFTITKMIDPAPAQGKLNIGAVCDGALAYMTFPDGKSADIFVAECKEGKHPEVIEEYKKQMGLGGGAKI